MTHAKKRTPDVSLNLVDEEGTPVPQSHAALYEKWRPEIDAIPESALRHYNADASLALSNAVLIEKRIEPLRAEIEALASFDHRLIFSLREIAAAAVWISALYRNREQSNPGPIAPRMRSLRKERQLLLRLAQAAEIQGLVSSERLAKIERGRGSQDVVDDVISLVEILRHEPRVVSEAGLLTPAHLEKIQEEALVLNYDLRPQNAPSHPRTNSEEQALRLRRDQCWTLLTQAHEQTYLAVATLVGLQEAGQLVQGLRSRQGLSSRSATDAPPTTTPTSEEEEGFSDA